MHLPVIVDVDSVVATRHALEDPGATAPVIGWVDLTSPNLVDLLDDLVGGPGGPRLVGVRSSIDLATLDDLPVQRGLATLVDLHLGFHTDDRSMRAALAGRWPLLRLLPETMP